MSGTTLFDTNNKASNVTLSGGSLVATLSNTTQGGVRATRITGQTAYVEFAVTLVGTTYRLGLANYSFGTGTVLGVDTLGVGINAADGTVKINNVTIGTVASFTTADTVDMAYNARLKLIWFRKNNGNWNGVGGADPASATLTDSQSGFSTATLATGGGGPLFPYFSSGGTTNAAVTAKFSTAFTRTAPTGYPSVDDNPGGIAVADVITKGPNSGTLCLGSARGNSDVVSTFEQINSFPQGWLPGISQNDLTKWTRQYSPAAAATHAAGTVTAAGSPVSKKVRVYDQATGEFLGECPSSAVDGSYSVSALGRSAVVVVCVDDTSTYNALVYDEVTPL